MTDICLRFCADPRVTDTVRAFEDAIRTRFGEYPHTQRQFGAELEFVIEVSGAREAAALRIMRVAFRGPVRKYILIGHVGPACGPGCAAYQDEYDGGSSKPIKRLTERELHWRNLNSARIRHQAAARHYGRDALVITLIDHHDSLELVTSAEHAPDEPTTIEIAEVLNLIADLHAPPRGSHSVHPSREAGRTVN